MRKPVNDMRNELIALVQVLEPDAVEVLHMQAARLARGKEQYGALDVDKDRRDWAKETAEELVDGLTYLNLELMKLRRAR